MSLLAVSKFSLCQSPSTVTKSVGASCQSDFCVLKRTQKAVCWYIEQPRDSCIAPALRHNKDFNIATAQRPREAMQVFIQINKICSHDTGLCSRRNLENALDIGPYGAKEEQRDRVCTTKSSLFFGNPCKASLQHIFKQWFWAIKRKINPVWATTFAKHGYSG